MFFNNLHLLFIIIQSLLKIDNVELKLIPKTPIGRKNQRLNISFQLVVVNGQIHPLIFHFDYWV